MINKVSILGFDFPFKNPLIVEEEMPAFRASLYGVLPLASLISLNFLDNSTHFASILYILLPPCPVILESSTLYMTRIDKILQKTFFT